MNYSNNYHRHFSIYSNDYDYKYIGRNNYQHEEQEQQKQQEQYDSDHESILNYYLQTDDGRKPIVQTHYQLPVTPEQYKNLKEKWNIQLEQDLNKRNGTIYTLPCDNHNSYDSIHSISTYSAQRPYINPRKSSLTNSSNSSRHSQTSLDDTTTTSTNDSKKILNTNKSFWERTGFKRILNKKQKTQKNFYDVLTR